MEHRVIKNVIVYIVAVRVDLELLSNLGHATIASRYSALHRTNSCVPDEQREALEFDLSDLELGVAELGLASTNGGTRSYLVCKSRTHVAEMRRCWNSGLVRDVLERVCRTLCDGFDLTIERSTFNDEACAHNLTRLGRLISVSSLLLLWLLFELRVNLIANQ